MPESATYYFAMKVRDNVGNESGLSNVATGITGPATIVFSDDVENGANGWTSSGLWHQSTLLANSPLTSWYYGIEATRIYDTGTANSGQLTSPAINLTNVVRPVLIYREWRQVEDVGDEEFFDSAQVQISAVANKWDTVSRSEFSTSFDPLNWQSRAGFYFGWNVPLTSSTPLWVSRAVDLSPVGQ